MELGDGRDQSWILAFALLGQALTQPCLNCCITDIRLIAARFFISLASRHCRSAAGMKCATELTARPATERKASSSVAAEGSTARHHQEQREQASWMCLGQIQELLVAMHTHSMVNCKPRRNLLQLPHM